MEINVADHTRLAHMVAWRYKRVADKLNVDYDDLQQIALIGIWQATQKFDPDKGFTFSTFASRVAINHIKMYFRRVTTGKYMLGNPIGEQDFMDHLSSSKSDNDFRAIELRLTIQQIASNFKGVKKRIIDSLLSGTSVNREQLAREVGCTSSYTYLVMQDLKERLVSVGI